MTTNVGLDIGTSAVRAAAVQMQKGIPVLKRYGQVALTEGAVIGGEIVDPELVRDALITLWKSAKLPKKRVVVGVANQRIVVRRLDVPYMSEDELRESLAFRAAEYIPMAIDDAVLDFVPLEEFATPEGEAMLSVLVIAAQKDMIDEVLGVVSGAGIKPMALDLQAFAMVRAAFGTQFDTLPGSQAMINIGAGVTQIVILRNGTAHFLRIMPIGGSAFTKALASSAAVSVDEAERMKRRIGVLPEGNADTATDRGQAALTREADTLIDEVRGSLDFYLSEAKDETIQRVLISGNGARLPHLANRLASKLDVPIEPLRLLSADRVQVGKLGMSEAELAQIEPVLPVPLGLAMWGES